MSEVVEHPVAAMAPDQPYPVHPYPVHQHVAAPDRFTAFLLRVAKRSPRWAGPAAILACFASGAVYTLVSDPTDADASSVTTCLVKLTTGFDCPGCGGTRAFWYLLHGDLPAAARHHALVTFAAPFLLYMYVAWAGNRLFGWRLPMLRPSPTVISVFLAAWGVFTVVRNLPWAAFTWMYV
ncbi:MAG TPA: DUF2752 domain-containing protein [Micromonosporaceae bacterium]